jgi:ABC-type glutathione transport system ATPase component
LTAILEREKKGCGGGLLVTHDLEMAASIADRGVVLDGGVIIASFTNDEMKAQEFRQTYQNVLLEATR